MLPNPQETTYTEEILSGKLHFLCIFTLMICNLIPELPNKTTFDDPFCFYFCFDFYFPCSNQKRVSEVGERVYFHVEWAKHCIYLYVYICNIQSIRYENSKPFQLKLATNESFELHYVIKSCKVSSP